MAKVRPQVEHHPSEGRAGPAGPVSGTWASPAALRAQGATVCPPIPEGSPRCRGQVGVVGHLPCPSPTALLPPQASAASHTPQLNSDGLPCSGERSGLCAGLSVVAALRESNRIRAQLPVPDRSPEMAAGPEPASIHSERLRAARDRWVRGWQPRHSPALRTWCCWPLLSLGHFMQPIKIAVFLPCLSVPGPPQEKHGCKQSLPSGCPGIGCGEPWAGAAASQQPDWIPLKLLFHPPVSDSSQGL